MIPNKRFIMRKLEINERTHALASDTREALLVFAKKKLSVPEEN